MTRPDLDDMARAVDLVRTELGGEVIHETADEFVGWPELVDAARRAEAASSAGPPEAIIGNWTGEVAPAEDTAAATLADLRRQIRGLYTDMLSRRAHWANSEAPGSVARAVAYQSMAGRLQRIIEANEGRDSR